MLEQRLDNELMESVKDGDSRAFRLLVERHLPKSHAIALRVLYSQADAEEAAQDAFTKVWVNAVKFDGRQANFGTWFYQILIRTCIDMLRKRPPRHSDIADMQELLADTKENQEITLSLQQDALRIKAAIQLLPERQRVAVVLCYFEDMTNSEVAVVMGLHIKALEGLLVRARKKLRLDLGG